MGFGPAFAKQALRWRRDYPYGVLLPVGAIPNPKDIDQGLYGPFVRMPGGDGKNNEWRFQTSVQAETFAVNFGGRMIP